MANRIFNKSSVILVAIILVAMGLRVAAALYLGDRVDTARQERAYDQVSYQALAISLLAGRGYSFEHDWYPGFTPAHTPTAHWSFLYPLYLVLVYVVGGVHPLAARLLQVVLVSILKTWLIYRLGRGIFNEKVGLAGAALSAVYVYFIFYDATLMTEPFFMCAVLAILLLGLRMTGLAKDSPGRAIGWGWWALLGAVAGLASLLRQTVLFWLPVQLIWMEWVLSRRPPMEQNGIGGRWKRPLLGSLLCLGVAGLLILPWAVRNYVVYGAFLPLNSNAGYALYSANHPDHGVNFMQSYGAPLPEDLLGTGLNEATWNTALTRRGLEFALQDPTRYFKLSLSKAAVQFRFWFDARTDPGSNWMRLLSFGVYLPFFIAGLALSLKDWRRSVLIYLFVVIFNLLHILTWGGIRYRLPVDAALMPYAGLALVTLAEVVYSRMRNGRVGQEGEG
jgi:hypothetical protein